MGNPIGVETDRTRFTLTRRLEENLPGRITEDEARYKKRVKEAIARRLNTLIADEAVVKAGFGTMVRVYLPGLEDPRIRYDLAKNTRIGQGDGSKKGEQGQEIIKAGKPSGIGNFETEIPFDDLYNLATKDWRIPNKQKIQDQSSSVSNSPIGYVNRGPLPHLDIRQTIRANIRREAVKGQPWFHKADLQDQDLRFRVFDPDPAPATSAVIIAMRDISGTTGAEQRYWPLCFYTWSENFLRSNYSQVQTVFITHHTQAKEVTKEDFFKLTEPGSTKVSSAYQLGLDILDRRYSLNRWNVYLLHFSDGASQTGEDSRRSVSLIRGYFERGINIFGYCEVRKPVAGYFAVASSGISALMKELAAITDPRFIRVSISKVDDVYPALCSFLIPRTERLVHK